MSNRFKKNKGLIAFVVALAVLLSLGLFGLAANSDDNPPAPADDPTATATATPTEDNACATWRMKKSTPANGDWVTEVPSIKSAQTKAEARAAANDWVDLVKKHPETLRGAAAYILDERIKANVLVNDKGCASNRAEELVTEIKLALASSLITAGQAPADGRNSGADPKDGSVYAYSFEGVDGDRKAIKIVLPDGRIVWVMARCGNPVVKTPPPVETDCKKGCNPPPPPKGCPPGQVPYEGRCVKESSDDGVGGNDSPASQPVGEHPQGGTPGAGDEPPKDDDPGRTPDDNGQSDHGSPGDGGAGAPTGPSDEDHSDDDTTHTDSPECPLGPGNC